MQHPFSTHERRGSLVKQMRTCLFFSMGLLLVVLIIHLSVSILTSVIQRQRWMDTLNFVATGISLLLSLLVILLLWRMFTRFASALYRQLAVFEDTSNRLGEGDFSARVPELESQELSQLGKIFNTMAVALQQQSMELKDRDVYEHIQAQTEELAAKNREQEQMNVALRVQRNELRILNSMLEEANEARTQFLSTMTHELRTPLTAILGFSQIILRDLEYKQRDEQRSRDNVERIIKNGNHLLNLINDTLDLVKIEAGHMNVIMSAVELPALISNVIEEIRPLADEKKLTLQVHSAEGIDEIESDPGKLHQILLNLISNAIKFTAQGEVSVSVACQIPPESKEKYVAITVKDTGIGIAPEVQEHIFDAFYQGDSSITRKYGGTGLGLSIVHQLTFLLGGTLELVSSPGQGSAFTLYLPQVPITQYDEHVDLKVEGEKQEASA